MSSNTKKTPKSEPSKKGKINPNHNTSFKGTTKTTNKPLNNKTSNNNNSKSINTTKKNEKKEIDPLEGMKKKIQTILEESNDKINTLSLSFSQIDINAECSYSKAQEEYSKELDEIYNEKINKQNVINEKYDFEFYENKKKFYDDDPIFEKILKEKEGKLKEIQDEFLKKKNDAKLHYANHMKEIKENSIQQRKLLFDSSIYDVMKTKINEIIEKEVENPVHEKKDTSKKSTPITSSTSNTKLTKNKSTKNVKN